LAKLQILKTRKQNDKFGGFQSPQVRENFGTNRQNSILGFACLSSSDFYFYFVFSAKIRNFATKKKQKTKTKKVPSSNVVNGNF
jgi:hypothetical protein